jgi:PPOX class probable F420-dependent enzyme
MTMPNRDTLGSARYVSLATFRRNGAEVATPVWIAASDDRLYVFSESRAGKVKRLRSNPQLRLAHCDMRGHVLSDWTDAVGAVIDDTPTIENAYRALRKKYGWQMWVADFFSKLSGRYAQRSMLEISVGGQISKGHCGYSEVKHVRTIAFGYHIACDKFAAFIIPEIFRPQ